MSSKKTNNSKKPSHHDLNGEAEQFLADFIITSHILCALKTNPQIPVHDVEVVTRKGCVTLSGQLQWEFQMGIVKQIVKKLHGIKELNNHIDISSFKTYKSIWSFSAN